MAEIRWKIDPFLGAVNKELEKRFVSAGVYFVSKTRGYLNTSQPYRRTRSGGHVGLDPSKPGQFPHKLSGQLQRSVTWKFDKSKMVLTVGFNLKGYPKYLETGTKDMRPRPTLKLSWGKEKNNMGRILTGK